MFISDKQYLIELLNQRENALLTTNKIKQGDIANTINLFASKIIYNRTSELNDIHTILKVL